MEVTTRIRPIRYVKACAAEMIREPLVITQNGRFDQFRGCE